MRLQLPVEVMESVCSYSEHLCTKQHQQSYRKTRLANANPFCHSRRWWCAIRERRLLSGGRRTRRVELGPFPAGFFWLNCLSWWEVPSLYFVWVRARLAVQHRSYPETKGNSTLEITVRRTTNFQRSISREIMKVHSTPISLRTLSMFCLTLVQKMNVSRF